MYTRVLGTWAGVSYAMLNKKRPAFLSFAGMAESVSGHRCFFPPTYLPASQSVVILQGFLIEKTSHSFQVNAQTQILRQNKIGELSVEQKMTGLHTTHPVIHLGVGEYNLGVIFCVFLPVARDDSC